MLIEFSHLFKPFLLPKVCTHVCTLWLRRRPGIKKMLAPSSCKKPLYPESGQIMFPTHIN